MVHRSPPPRPKLGPQCPQQCFGRPSLCCFFGGPLPTPRLRAVPPRERWMAMTFQGGKREGRRGNYTLLKFHPRKASHSAREAPSGYNLPVSLLPLPHPSARGRGAVQPALSDCLPRQGSMPGLCCGQLSAPACTTWRTSVGSCWKLEARERSLAMSAGGTGRKVESSP